MLTESFIASVSAVEKTSKKDSNMKDAGIYLYEYQPLPALRSNFKKSSTKPNCLVVGVSHVFAAQHDKAVVHVYNRERGNQESTIPFPEKICSVALLGGADGGGVLAMGTEGGRLILWEVGCLTCAFGTELTIQSSFALAVKSQLPNLIYRLRHV